MSGGLSQSSEPFTAATALAALFPISDADFKVKGSSDATKLWRVEVDGNTTATTRVATVADLDVRLAGSASALTNGRVPKGTATSGVIADSGIADGTSGGGVLTFAAAASFTITYVATGTGIVGTLSNANRILSVSAAGVAKESLVQDGVTAGALTLAKTGVTARTHTFQDLAGTVSALEATETHTGAKTITNGTTQPLTLTRSDTGATSGNVLALTTASGGGLQIGVDLLSGANPTWITSVNASESWALAVAGVVQWTMGSTGRLRGGFVTGRTVGGVTNGGKFATEGLDTSFSSWSAVANIASTGSGVFARAKTRGTAAGDVTAVQSGDTVWTDDWCGADGTDVTTVGVRVRAFCSGAVSAGIVPMDLRFFTMNAAGSLTEALRLDLNSNVGLGAYAPVAGNGLLQLASGTTKANGIAWGTDVFLYRDGSNSLLTEGAFRSNSATGGIGYATGAGGTVTQITSRATGVTLNRINGEITLVSAAGSAVAFSFTVACSAMAATDHVVLNQKSGADKYMLLLTAKAAGSFQITAFTTGGITVETPVISFAIIKGTNA